MLVIIVFERTHEESINNVDVAVTVTAGIVEKCRDNSGACDELFALSEKMEGIAQQFWHQVTVPKS
ncbi:hypothetical protein [Marinomonas gallaica]|uniref:hypothetical protein n=1 Tax=Marinomonas gallaica TaxID=1806667 RepID=UPI000831BA57|nr:hypothetical protein [Marinomonas gallaica]